MFGAQTAVMANVDGRGNRRSVSPPVSQIR